MSGEPVEGDVLPPESEPPSASAQPAADTTPALMALLDAMRTGSVDPQKMMFDLVGSQAADRPETAMLLKLLAGGDEAEKQAALREELRAEVREEEAEKVARLAEVSERMLAENAALQERMEALAAALGACPECLGEDPLCATCDGAGSPGSRLPEAEAFHLYVRPAVERVRAALSRAAPRRPWPRNPAASAAVLTPARAGARP
ncbi:MAG: hypothetical protein JO013_00690 [Alphaproteobacteria bacterium]|nr:hypothetical protein [Alphaproteobacteria bacterium]